MRAFRKSTVILLSVLFVSCGKKSKQEESGSKEDVTENAVPEKKERKDIEIGGLAYGSTFDKDNETTFEEVYASYGPDRFHRENSSIVLDGISDHVIIENHENLNPEEAITVAVWYKPDSFKGNGSNSVLNKGFDTEENPFIQYAFIAVGDTYPSVPGTFKFLLSINGKFNSLPTRPNTWTPGQWYLLTGTFDGKRMAFYVNGQLITARSVTGKVDRYDTPLLIGKTPHKELYTSGSVDDLMLFDRALTPQEIVSLYANR